jgi:AcrR family transcriptional regulator
MAKSPELDALAPPELEIHRALRHAVAAQPAPPPEYASKAPRKRVELILECALRLFNQHGVTGISTNRISAELGISPGNVHYHYRTKGDLLLACFQILDAELREACFGVTVIAGAAGYVDWQIAVQTVLWRHRYFFGALEIVLRTMPDLRLPWLLLQSAVVHQLASTHAHYIKTRQMKLPQAPNTIEQVAQNCLMLWISWIRWEFLALDARTPATAEDNAIIHRLVTHHLSFYEPYHVRSQRGAEALIRELNTRLLSAPPPSPIT